MLKDANSKYLSSLQKQAEAAKKQIVVSALILNKDKIFVQKRSSDRKLFPNCWDVVGGHLEKGENIISTLSREIKEETSWQLEKILGHFYTFDWQAQAQEKREFAFLLIVSGDLKKPILEKDKHSEFLWLASNQLEILKDKPDDLYIYELVKKAFSYL